MKVWFTADTHFDHPSILEHHTKSRPFDSIEQMNSHIIANWNQLVSKGDNVYHLGDFGWREPARMLELLKSLNGQVHLIAGNHDRRINKAVKNKLASYSKIKTIDVNNQPIVLCHYAMRTWAKQHYGAWQLYGHSHGSLPELDYLLAMDVGMDCWGLKPIDFDTVKSHMATKTWTKIDHHEPDEDSD